jgi:hypothetical protein
MARGFESKDVEQQQQDAAERRQRARLAVLSAEEAERNRKRDGLLLQRTRVLREIEVSTSDRHRLTLQNGLQYLDEQLATVAGVPLQDRPA